MCTAGSIVDVAHCAVYRAAFGPLPVNTTEAGASRECFGCVPIVTCIDYLDVQQCFSVLSRASGCQC